MTREQAQALIAGLPQLTSRAVQALITDETRKLEPTNRLGAIEVSEALWSAAHTAMKASKLREWGAA